MSATCESWPQMCEYTPRGFYTVKEEEVLCLHERRFNIEHGQMFHTLSKLTDGYSEGS